MFTGIVEAVGRVAALEPAGEGARLRVEAGCAAGGLALGDSVAVNGACLTVCGIAGEQLAFDAVAETLRCTNLGSLRPGARVNLERALRAGAGLDGHIVQGHVDGTGEVLELLRRGADVRLRVACGPEVARDLVDKGSVAVDGVSLTAVEAGERGFEVALIPHTLEHTTLGERSPGDRVNLEADVLGKYVRRYLERIGVGGC